MRVLTRITDVLLIGLSALGAFAVLMLMTHVVTDVIARNMMNRPLPATYEIVTHYYMIALAFIPLAWVERQGGMVAVELLDGILPSSAIRASDIFVSLFSTAVYLTLAWVTWNTALKNFNTGTFAMALNVRLPTWPAYFLPPVGFFLAGLVTSLRFISQITKSKEYPA